MKWLLTWDEWDWTMCALFSHLNISVVSMNDLCLGQLMWMIVMMKCQSFLASTSHPVNIFNKQILLCLYSFYLFYLFCIIQLCCRMNRSRESASQSLSINQSYSHWSIHSHSGIPHISSQFLLHSVMEYLVQIQSSIITIQDHFHYVREIVTSFEWR